MSVAVDKMKRRTRGPKADARPGKAGAVAVWAVAGVFALLVVAVGVGLDFGGW